MARVVPRVVATTKPPNVERFPVVVVMGVGGLLPASLARFRDEIAANLCGSNGVVGLSLSYPLPLVLLRNRAGLGVLFHERTVTSYGGGVNLRPASPIRC